MAKHKGRLELTWTDKDKTLLSSEEGKYDYQFVDPSDRRVSEVRLLHEVDRFEFETPTDRSVDLPAPTSENLLITGDAMHALDAIAKIPEYADKYLGKIKLVYIDPPFNTGQAFSNYEDNIEHSVWLTMLRDRLRQIKPLLASEASVWVHLDHVESHRCRVVLDEEFGAENFVGEVAWQKTTSPRNDTNRISVSQDPILVYRTSSRWRPNRVSRLASSNTSRYKSRDGDPVPWRDGDATAAGARSNDETSIFAVQHPVTGGLMYPPEGRHWAMNQSWMLDQLRGWAPYELREIDDRAKRAALRQLPPEKARAGVKAIMLSVPIDESSVQARAVHRCKVWPDIVFLNIEKERMQRKKHLVDDGRVPETLWSHEDIGGSMRAKGEINDLFPDQHAFATPKPERLLERVIHIGTEQGDIVLDCFAGSGTTAAVAHKMGRRWVASELLPATMETFTKPRLQRVVEGTDPGGITSSTTRVASGDIELPEGMSADEAQEFNRLLSKVTKALGDDAEADTLRPIRAATRTRDVTTTNWHGGGGFMHVEVGPSMFVELDGMVLLADWATQNELTRAMCAQLSVRHAPDGIFAGRKGRVRYVILDGLVVEDTLTSVLDQLPEGEIVEVWATQVDESAIETLRRARPGSRLEVIPASVLDTYRRKAAKSPFTKTETTPVADQEHADD